MKRRLLVSYVAVTAVVLILLAVPLGLLESRQENDALRATARREAAGLAVIAAAALTNPTGHDLAALAARYRLVSGSEVAIVDSSGHQLVALDPDERGGAAREMAPELTTALTGRAVTIRLADEDGPQMAAILPVRDGDRLLGAVGVTVPAAATDRHVRRVWLVLGALALALLAFTSTIGIVLARSLTAPLAALQRAAARLGHGDLTARAPTHGPPEVAALADDFNTMATQITDLVATNRRFVADAAHQLRTSLTALRLRLENMAAGGDVAVADDVVACQSELDRLSRLVDGVLTLSRAESHAGNGRDPNAVDPFSIAADRCRIWAPLAEERDVALAFDGDGQNVTVCVRPGDLEQILDNLLDNALDASPAGGTITVSIVTGRRDVELRVRDQGPGLTADERIRAFDRFWQGRSHATGSSGLGLAIVKELARANGGSAVLEPAPGTGLDAVVTIPYGAPQPSFAHSH